MTEAPPQKNLEVPFLDTPSLFQALGHPVNGDTLRNSLIVSKPHKNIQS